MKAKSIRFLGHFEACWVIAEIIWTLTHTKKITAVDRTGNPPVLAEY